MPKKEPKTGEYVCGKKIEEIRKAYFDGKVDDLCADILAEQSMSPEDIKALGKVLDGLQKEETKMREDLKKEVNSPLFKGDKALPPSLHELSPDPTEEELMAKEKWDKERDWSVDKAKEMIRYYGKNALTNVPLDRNKAMNDGFAMDLLRMWLLVDMREKKLEAKKRFIEILDKFDLSRKEAEDRSEITRQYVEAKKAEDLAEISASFVMNAKKIYGGQNF